MNLDEIKRRLKTRIQPFLSIPNPEQLHEAVISAIDNLSEKAPKLKKATISIVSGTGEYALPNDFQSLSEISLISQQSGYMSGNVLMSGSNIKESIRVVNGMLMISPTPTVDTTAVMYYYARYLPSLTNTYDLSQDQVTALLWNAISIISQMKADKAAEQAWVEQNQDQRVDMSKRYLAFQEESKSANEQYKNAIMSLVSQSTGSPYGTRSSYNENPYDPWNGRILEDETY